MSPSPGAEVWALLPLALAAGLDLYLTLFALGTAALLGWEASVPGALSGLESGPVLILAAVFWLLEALAERSPGAGLFWNTGHVIVRAVTGGLLALLLLHGEPALLRAAGALFAGSVAVCAHAFRMGGAFVLWLSGSNARTRLIASLTEDVMVLALCVLVLDHPVAGTVLGAVMIVATVPLGRPYVDGLVFGLRSAWGRTWGSLGSRRWLDRDALPPWVIQRLEGDGTVPGGPLRGSPAAAFRLAATGLFRRGWLVVTGGGPVFVHRESLRGHPEVEPLASIRALAVEEGPFHRRVVFLDSDGRPGQLHVPHDGPSAEGLRAEFVP